MMRGYWVPGGYMGRLDDGSWMCFPNDREYHEYMEDRNQ